jgi:cystathionine gamma-synthase
MTPHDIHPQTLAVHAGNDIFAGSSDVTPPLHFATTFERNAAGENGVFSYTRLNNPNRLAVEAKLAALEGARTAMCFGSGMAAVNALFENLLQPGAHVILPDDGYHGTRSLANTFFSRWQVRFTEVDMTGVANVKNAVTPDTRLIWLETPSNPQLKIADIAAIATIAKERNIVTACDNTFATPLLQKPLAMGVDYVMHSSTKFFSGHSDILGGAVLTNHDDEASRRMRQYQTTAGAVPAPFDCWLLHRSLATFPLRFARQCENALALAQYLQQHASIEKVFYPGLPTHTNHALALAQMRGGFGGVLSILVKGGREAAFAFASKLQIFKHATSLGGVESLVEHRRSAEGNHPVSADNLLRISVGIEHVDDLIRDMEQALA